MRCALSQERVAFPRVGKPVSKEALYVGSFSKIVVSPGPAHRSLLRKSGHSKSIGLVGLMRRARR